MRRLFPLCRNATCERLAGKINSANFTGMKRAFFCLVLSLLLSACNYQYAEKKAVNSCSEDLYSYLKLSEKGLPKTAFDYAITGMKKLEQNNKLKNERILTIADYSQPSSKKRLYVIDLKERKLLFNTYVAHGRNSGDLYATKFSNKEGSLQSSLGFYITGNTLNTTHTGFSLYLHGVEKGINDLAEKRAIIVHGAPYVSEEFIKKWGRLGRSFGCPALPAELYKPVIELIKEGSCLFIYSNDPSYLTRSGMIR
jgi:hypothetical protein